MDNLIESNLGHRKRLRERLLKAGRQGFSDHELLELLLTYSIPRKDTKKIAKVLINRFGSFTAIFDQPRERLIEVKGIGPYTATFFQAIREFMVRYLEQEVEYAENPKKSRERKKKNEKKGTACPN
jgi:DNA repair protein RadC